MSGMVRMCAIILSMAYKYYAQMIDKNLRRIRKTVFYYKALVCVEF